MKYELAVTNLPSWEITKELSDIFSRKLCAALSNKKIEKIITLNQTSEYKNCCSSHEFCDSNMLMSDALDDLFIKWDLTDPIINLINDSWELSIINNFNYKG